MLDGDPTPEEFERDVQGDVAFYSADNEVIRFVLASPPLPSASSPPPPVLASASPALADGSLVGCSPSDDWHVSGRRFAIPESVMALDATGSARLRRAVAGFSFSSTSPCSMARVGRGVRLGECYPFGVHVVGSLMSGAMFARADRCLLSAPSTL